MVTRSRDTVLAETLARSHDGPPTAPPGEVPAIRGRSLGRYLLLSELGAGAMGIVYAAYDPELDRRVALKLLKHPIGDRAAPRKRLQREAQALARLDHPNVVAVYDVGVHDDHLFIAMEFVAGKTLATWMSEAEAVPTPSGRFGAGAPPRVRPWREVLAVFAQAGRGLAAAHEVGLVHRDVKPESGVAV
jgi:eukaryotic-like serine/threonine-protein kinase